MYVHIYMNDTRHQRCILYTTLLVACIHALTTMKKKTRDTEKQVHVVMGKKSEFR